MYRRISALAATAVLTLTLSACGSATGGSAGGHGGGSGGSTGGSSGGSSDGAPVAGDSPTMNVDNGSAAPGNSGNAHARTSDDFDGCKIWFGFSQGSSATYLISASKEGIGGHVQWKCSSQAVGVDRLRLKGGLEHAFTLAGPYTTETSSVSSGGGTKSGGSLFPLTSYCTTDWWRVRVTVGWDETGGGPQTRPDLVSESRKVTDEDCNRN